MRVAYFTGVRQLEIREEPEPKLTQPGDVRVRIDRVGVCGSDVHYYAEGRIGNQIVQFPATLGHECSGTVVEVGEAVQRLKPGARVAVEPAFSCGQCDQCRAGRENTCRKIQFMGCPGQALGAVADYHILPAENCLPIPDCMTLDQAALIEPLAIGVYAAKMADVFPAARIAVFGSGPIGLSVALCAKVGTPCTIYATDLLDERLAVARQCGADWTGNPRRQDVVAEIARLEPQGLDMAFECSGDPACIAQAINLLAPGGVLFLIGIPPTVEVSFDAHRMRTKELTFRAVRRQKGCTAAAIRLVGDGFIDTSPLVTHRFPLEKIRDAFELVAGYGDGVIKAMIDLSSAE